MQASTDPVQVEIFVRHLLNDRFPLGTVLNHERHSSCECRFVVTRDQILGPDLAEEPHPGAQSLGFGCLDQRLGQVVGDENGNPGQRLGASGNDQVGLAGLVGVQQLDCGANCWGIFHYSSSDTTTSRDFAETVITLASNYGMVDIDN